jgi:uncharacterized protein YbjT (DUF2867 family)
VPVYRRTTGDGTMSGTMTTTFLITGATGTVGSALVAMLAARGARVRAMMRYPERAALPASIERVAGDLGDEEAVGLALAGVDRVFHLSGGPDGPIHDDIMAKAARAAGVRHVVKLSVLGVHDGDDDLVTQWHRSGERSFLDAGLSTTFVRPNGFMSNTLHWAPSIAAAGTVYAPVGDLPVAWVDPIDVSAVAYQLLVQPGPPGTGYPVTGPAAITPREQVAILGEVLRRPITFVEISPDEARAQLVHYGMPDLLADGAVGSMTSPVRGFGQTPTTTVEALTGLEPRRYRDWAFANRDGFLRRPPEWSA